MARLATQLFASAILREVHSRGGTGAVLYKGDPVSGALLLLHAYKGDVIGAYDYVLNASGRYILTPLTAQTLESVDSLCARRRKSDPDLWIVEVDIADGERFIADFGARD
jgi:hypothetical protein